MQIDGREANDSGVTAEDNTTIANAQSLSYTLQSR
jgi:hypothetical protein